jgi:protein-tyrosine phosphatase
MVVLARDRGVKLRAHRAQALKEAQLASTDLIFAMEKSHLEALERGFPDWPGQAELLDPLGTEILDPYFGSKADVRAAFERIEAVCVERAHRFYARCVNSRGAD